MRKHTPTAPYLTVAGKQLLARRLRVLERHVLDLRADMEDPEVRTEAFGTYLRVAGQRDRLQSLLDEAQTVEEVVFDDPGLAACATIQ